MFSISISAEMLAHCGWVLLGKEISSVDVQHIWETNENGHLCFVLFCRALTSGSGVALALLLGANGPLIGVAISASLLPPVVNCVSKTLNKISICAIQTVKNRRMFRLRCIRIHFDVSMVNFGNCCVSSYFGANESFPVSSLSRSQPSTSLRPA